MIKKEEGELSFICENCGHKVQTQNLIGTKNRNHCPRCLISKHLDLDISGDRESLCKGVMDPVALTLKREGYNKYGEMKKGEVMIVHRCRKCGEFSINRLAGDDEERVIFKLFGESIKNKTLLEEMTKQDIIPMLEDNKEELFIKLFGKGTNMFL